MLEQDMQDQFECERQFAQMNKQGDYVIEMYDESFFTLSDEFDQTSRRRPSLTS